MLYNAPKLCMYCRSGNQRTGRKTRPVRQKISWGRGYAVVLMRNSESCGRSPAANESNFPLWHKGWFYRSLLINRTCFSFSRSFNIESSLIDSIILTLECLGFATKHVIHFILAKEKYKCISSLRLSSKANAL